MLSQKKKVSKRFNLVTFSVIALLLIIMPIFAFSSHKKDLYVNVKAGKIQNGSEAHPYKTIGKALDEADHKTEIHVAKGEYDENVTLKKGIKLLGDDKDNTIIKAKKDKWATVTMEGDSKIDGFTIKRGKRGVWVEGGAKASIIDCIVDYNKKDGIAIKGKDTKKSHQVVISKSEVRDNGQAGVYSTGARRVVIEDSEITDNKSDGIDLARGTSAWISKNKIKNNKGSGLKLTIDRSNIWTKNNSIRDNNREGLEISFFGQAGRINIAKSKIVDNDLYGIARIQRASFSSSLWSKYLTFDNRIKFWGNKRGNISRIFFMK